MLKDYPYIRQVRSPLIKDQLRPLDPRCQTVQFSSLLSKRDFASLAQFLQQYPAVELRVYGSYDESITNLKFLEYFPFVKRFAVDVWQLESFEGIDCLPSALQSLRIGNTKSKRHSLKLLRHFPELKELYIEGHVKDIQTVGELIRLEDLTLRSITIPNLSILTPLNQLKLLDIKLGGTKNLDLLPRIGKLQYIELWRIRGLKDLSPVADVETLQFLFLQDLSQVTNFPSLSKLSHLRRLHIQTLKGLKNLDFVTTTPSLEELIILNMRHLSPNDFKQLVGYPPLKYATIDLGSDKKNKTVREMLSLPRVNRVFTYS